MIDEPDAVERLRAQTRVDADDFEDWVRSAEMTAEDLVECGFAEGHVVFRRTNEPAGDDVLVSVVMRTDDGERSLLLDEASAMRDAAHELPYVLAEVRRLRAEVATHKAIWEWQEDPELLDDLIAVDYEARGAKVADDDRTFFSQTARRAYAAIMRLGQENEELRDAYRRAVEKLGSLPTGWQDDIRLRQDLLEDDDAAPDT